MTSKDNLLYFLYLHRTGLTVCVLTLVLAVYPLLWGNPYLLGVTNQVALYTIVVLGLNLFIGFAGQISLGHAGFFALGAYGSALLSGEAGVTPWLALALAVLGGSGGAGGLGNCPAGRHPHPAPARPLPGDGHARL